MRGQTSVTQRRVPVGDHANILSTTDPKGRITYVNQEFLDISGFRTDELIGKPHNVIRHPDMPRQAFFEMWRTLQRGESWMGMVKNRCRNGDHYWVHAYVTPILDEEGSIQEYQSVRQQPDEADVERADALYRRIRAREPDQGRITATTERGRFLSVRARVGLGCGAALAPVVVPLGMTAPPALTGGALLVSAGLFFLALRYALAPVRRIERSALGLSDDPLAEAVFCGRHDESARVTVALTRLQVEMQAVTKRLGNAIGTIRNEAGTASDAIRESRERSDRQTWQTRKVTSAMEQMASAVQQVAQSAASSLDTTEQARERVQHGRQAVEDTRKGMERLDGNIETSSTVIGELSTESERISKALNIIQEITEKTNLLSLNAAIEASRAGEAGRGFSVVAEEVRALAQSTAESTRNIQEIIEALQQRSGRAVEAMRESRTQAETARSQAHQAREALDGIASTVDEIRDAASEIASSTEQQSRAAETVNENMSTIDELAGDVRTQATRAEDAMTTLADEIQGAAALVSRFATRRDPV